MRQTENYKLNLIETSDTFSPEALNGNMEKLDEVLHGQLRFATGEYTGDGKSGKTNPMRLEFGFKPLVVLVCHATSGNYGHFPWVRGASLGCVYRYDSNPSVVQLTWEDGALEWYFNGTHERFHLNEKGTRYVYLAIGVAD